MTGSVESLEVEFSPQDSGAEFRGDVPTKHTFEKNYDNYYETFVREVLQNANDASLENDKPVRVEFRFEVLSGEELDIFKHAINWSKLNEHYQAAIGEEHILRLSEYLTNLNETGEMLVLTVEDYNTIGLSGTEDDKAGETPYTSLVRDWQVTYKEGSSAGGSHGVGKSVLWASSGVSTVLFNSIPQDPSGGHTPPRLVGRSILPDHYLDDTHHHGKAWIGRERSGDAVNRPVSVWGSEAEQLASQLNLDRSTDESGTSILVPGFCSPTRSIRPAIDSIIPEFVRAAARNFWPAIHRERLEVVVKEAGGEKYEITKNSLGQVPEIAPFVACYEGRQSPAEDITEPGDVGVTTLPVEFTRREDDEQINGEATLCARLKDPSDNLDDDDQEYDLTNNTAIFRGSGMVVDYVSKSEPAVYGDDYYGVLIAGEARLWGETEGIDVDPDIEQEVDQFLTASEPASHDNWGSTPMLRKKYKQGCVSTVKSLQQGLLNRKLIELVQRDRSHDGRFVSSVARHLPEFGEVESDLPSTEIPEDDDDDDETSKTLRSNWDWSFDKDQWVFTGSIEPTDDPDGDWGVRFSIPKKGEDGATAGYEDVQYLESPTTGAKTTRRTVNKGSTSRRIGEMTVDAGIDEIEFECRSEQLDSLDPFSGHGGETTLRLRRDDPGGGD